MQASSSAQTEAAAITTTFNDNKLAIYTPEHKRGLGAALGACLVVQRTYGKQGADIQTMVNVFAKVLDDCQPDEVIEAIKTWLKQSPEFPTPHDIRQILKPQPVFTAAVFSEIQDKRRRGDIVTFAEEDYMKAYKAQALKGI